MIASALVAFVPLARAHRKKTKQILDVGDGSVHRYNCSVGSSNLCYVSSIVTGEE
jgi:hypothetical protein